MSSNKTLPVISSWYCMLNQIATMLFGSIAVNACLAKVTMYSNLHYVKHTNVPRILDKQFVSIHAKQQLVGY